jgi:dipeptidyl aminopeptidase/acylaminoacyl peptidase
MFNLYADFQHCWSPDGKRLAFMAYRHGGGSRDPGDATLYLLPQKGPRVELRTYKPRSPATQATAIALAAAGYVVTSIKRLKTPPSGPWIRVDSGYDQDKAGLAKAVSGVVLDTPPASSEEELAAEVDAAVTVVEPPVEAPAK